MAPGHIVSRRKHPAGPRAPQHRLRATSATEGCYPSSAGQASLWGRHGRWRGERVWRGWEGEGPPVPAPEDRCERDRPAETEEICPEGADTGGGGGGGGAGRPA